MENYEIMWNELGNRIIKIIEKGEELTDIRNITLLETLNLMRIIMVKHRVIKDRWGEVVPA